MTDRIAITDSERERFVDDLLAYMTLAEKIGQMVLLSTAPDHAPRRSAHDETAFYDRLRSGLIGGVGGVVSRSQAEELQRIALEETRLGIPLFFADDPVNGHLMVMPDPASAASSWDFAAVETAHRVIGDEVVDRGVNWALAPHIAFARDASVGEFASTSGSEAWLAARMAAARLRGLQRSPDAGDGGLIACLDLGETGTWSPEATLEVVTQAVRGGGAASIMLDPVGTPGHRDAIELLNTPGLFAGILLSEWSRLAILSGLEAQHASPYDLPAERVAAAVNSGRIPMGLVDDAVRRVLRAKFDLGLFRSPFLATDSVPAKAQPGRSPRDVAFDLARKSIVLLRNDPQVLPLPRDDTNILIVGTSAGDRQLSQGGASLLDGLESAGVIFKYVPGLALRQSGGEARTLIDADRMAIGMACEAARRASTVIVAIGSNASQTLGEAQRQLLASLSTVSERIVLVTCGPNPVDPLLNGRPLACVLHAGQLGSMAGHAIAAVLTGATEPTGRLPAPLAATGLPFGHGMGFGDFSLGQFALDLGADRINASIQVRNRSELPGTEVIQLYARHLDGDLPRPTSRLRGFQRVTLQPGEARLLNFAIGAAELGYPTVAGRFVLETGIYEISLGLDAGRVQTGEIALPSAVAAAMQGIDTGLSGYDRTDLRSA